MSEITLSRDARLTLRAQAHHLNPVVLLGASGLTEAVMKEIDRELKAVQMIGKLLVLWRPADEEEPTAEEWIARAAAAAKGLDKEAAAPAKKVAVKRPGDKKKKVEAQPRRRARPKTKCVTKKSALG